MNHLLKKCKALDAETRHRIACEVNNIPMDHNFQVGRNLQEDVQMNGPTVELPINNRNYRNLTALETLAEVARQTDSSDQQPGDGGRGDGRAPQQQLGSRLELQEQYTLDNPPVSYEQRTQREKRGLKRENDASAIGSTSNQPVSRSISPTLALAATRMAAAASAFVPSMLDPQLLADESNRDNSDDHRITQALDEATSDMTGHFFEAHDQSDDWPIVEGPNVNMYSDANINQIASHHNSPHLPYHQLSMAPIMTTQFTTEYGNGQKAIKPKSRARFDPNRKKEVSALRNKGACIRCRMLRKPCSLGDPCDTCKSVESARLWKGPCMRTKLDKELTMFSANLHVELSRRDIAEFKKIGQFSSSGFQIEASHRPATGIFATFNTNEARPTISEGLDPSLGGNLDNNASTLRLLDSSDDLSTKLEAYAKRMSPTFFQEEPSHFMNVTLNTAFNICMAKEDSLLSHALDLWSMVHILIDHDISWSMKVITITSLRGGGFDIEGGEKQILSQLTAAAEKKAESISKSVLKELEKRLVASPPHAKIELFLTTMIILNCVEKATWLFQSWEQETFNPIWPLSEPPSSFLLQGEKLSGILQNMLKMRNIIPHIIVSKEGELLAESSGDVAINEYFAALNLNCKYQHTPPS
jgi:hypothetical protein